MEGEEEGTVSDELWGHTRGKHGAHQARTVTMKTWGLRWMRFMFKVQMCINLLKVKCCLKQFIRFFKADDQPKFPNISNFRDTCGGALRFSHTASPLRTGSIPWAIGLHCLLLLYLISLGHVFDIQRKLGVTNECCKHKWMLFLCIFFG